MATRVFCVECKHSFLRKIRLPYRWEDEIASYMPNPPIEIIVCILLIFTCGLIIIPLTLLTFITWLGRPKKEEYFCKKSATTDYVTGEVDLGTCDFCSNRRTGRDGNYRSYCDEYEIKPTLDILCFLIHLSRIYIYIL